MTESVGLTKRWYPLRYHEVQNRAYRSRARFKVGLAGRRSGKTEVLGKRDPVKEMFKFTRAPDGLFVFSAPTLDQARRIYWEDLKALIPGQYVRRTSEARLEVKLINGVTGLIAGMDKPQRIEGQPIDFIVLDEYADMKPDAWTNSVRPGLDTMGRPGRATFIGKAKLGATHYRQLCNDIIEGRRPGWEYFHWSAESVLPKEIIDQAKHELDPLVYAYEYKAEWMHAEGRTYYPFMRSVHCRNLKYDPYLPLLFMFDFNISPGAAVVGQVQEFDGLKYLTHPDGTSLTVADTITAVIGEVLIPVNSNSQRVAKKLCEDWKDHKGRIICYGDATGGAKGSAKVSGSDWDLIKAELRPLFGDRVRYKVKTSNPLERVRVNSLNSRLLKADGYMYMLIDPMRAPSVVRDLEEVIWIKGGAAEIDKSDDNLTHWSDALSYYAEYDYPLGTEMITEEPLLI